MSMFFYNMMIRLILYMMRAFR